MSKFSQIAKGTRARKREKLPLMGARFSVETGEWDGPTVDVDIVALTPGEELAVFSQAREYCAKRGSVSEDDEAFQHAIRVFTLAKSCVDSESPSDPPAPFFDGGAEQVFASQDLTTEHVVYMYERYLLWRDETSPRLPSIKPEDFARAAVGIANGDETFFLAMRLGTLWHFIRTLASLHVNSHTHNSGSSSDSPEKPN